MKNMRIVHLAVLLALMLAMSLQPANGQSTDPVTTPAESSPALPGPSNGSGTLEINPLTISLAGGPDFDSGWMAIQQGQTVTLNHNLGGSSTDNYWVTLDYWNAGSGINQTYYGGADISDTNGHVGAYWKNLTTTSISVTRRANDTYAVKVRVRIWTDPSQMGYNNWNYIARGTYIDLVPSIPIDADNYLVDLRFNDTNPGGLGINQRFYGGKDCISTAPDCQSSTREGVTWYGLATSKASIFRMDEDTSCAPENSYFKFLTKIWFLPKPAYVSEWQPVPKDSNYEFTHDIGGNPDDYLVDLEYKSGNSSIGINHIYYGGARLSSNSPRTFPALGSPNDLVGAYWDHLTNSTINVHRNPQDQSADWVRVRIWNFWKPRPANYDSGWFNVSPGATPKDFDLASSGGSVSNYLVDLQFKNSAGTIHQHYYGSNQLRPSGNQVGAYWDKLTDNSIEIVRAAQDASVVQARLQIWIMPKPDVDTTLTLAPGNQTDYGHNLAGSVNNYLIDLEYSAPEYGVNQAAYGGFDTIDNKQVGVYWNTLTNSSIQIHRRVDDIYAATEIHLRMWRVAKPNYRSGFTPPKVFSHNLYQDPSNYFIAIMFNEGTSIGYHQQYYGGADLLDNSKVGGFWLNLTPRQVTVTQERDDSISGSVDVRIWVTKYNFYLPVLKKQ